MKITVRELESLIMLVLTIKYNKDDAEIIKDVILFAELSGHEFHGVLRLTSGTKESILKQSPTGKPEIQDISANSSVVKGNYNPGMLVASIAVKEAIQKAKKNNIAIVGTNNTMSTCGSLSYYLEKIASENLVGIVMARSTLTVAPFGSIEPLLGSNPIGFAVPSKDEPFILDMSTSAISYGEILKAKESGQNLPENSVIDVNGELTQDPEVALDGSVLPFANSYKSSGLALMVEILAGILPGAGFADQNENGWGNVFIVFKPQLLSDLEHFKKNMLDFVN
jgi:L-2-hydroxycarboxylate dehydrogenase (NAD+)